MMRFKTGLLALAATGGAAALAFGGTAASTAFSQDASGNLAVAASQVSMTTSTLTNVALSGLAPGGSASASFDVKNTSNTPADFYLTGVGFTPTKAGSGGYNPLASEITVTLTDTVTGPGGQAGTHSIFADVPLTTLMAQNTRLTPSESVLPGGTPANYTQHMTITFTLAQSAGNEWNGATASVPFTIHLQDASGTDVNGLVPTGSKH